MFRLWLCPEGLFPCLLRSAPHIHLAHTHTHTHTHTHWQVLPQLEQFEKVFLWLGNEPTARQAASHFARKLGPHRCHVIGLAPPLSASWPHHHLPLPSSLASPSSPPPLSPGVTIISILPGSHESSSTALATLIRGHEQLKSSLRNAKPFVNKQIVTFQQVNLTLVSNTQHTHTHTHTHTTAERRGVQ